MTVHMNGHYLDCTCHAAHRNIFLNDNAFDGWINIGEFHRVHLSEIGVSNRTGWKYGEVIIETVNH